MKKFAWLLAISAATLTSCNSTDCPLDNIVALTYGLYDKDTEAAYTIPETYYLTVTTTQGKELLNLAQSIKSFSIPLSAAGTRDTLLFHFKDAATNAEAVDTLIYEKTNEPHFENIDCPAAVFHTLGKLSWTTHDASVLPLGIDHVTTARSTVNYQDIENLKVYLRTQ